MKKVSLSITLVSFFIMLFFAGGFAQEKEKSMKSLSKSERYKEVEKQLKALHKALEQDDRHDELKETIITGNQIRVLLTNQGSISTPNADNANADLVWPSGPNGLGYSYEFGPLVGAEVIGKDGDTLFVINDGFLLAADGDFEPGTSERWGWEPRKGFSDPASNEVATFSDLDRNMDGKPDSWPENWFNDVLGRYVWPAFLGDDATTPDEEVFYVMDDFDNAEFEYYPFPEDSTIRGLGLELQVRIFQFNNPLAEDIIFLVYTITNVSPKTLNNVHLGMFGDPHVGGPGDFSDDFAGFISQFDNEFDENQQNMLYAWDEDGTGDQGKATGYFGYRFLESPGISNDGFDNDGDELTDEDQFNDAGSFVFRSDFGVYREPGFAWTGDEDGDWLPEFDDVGVDGIPGTGDFGEGDEKPNQLFYDDLNNNGILDAGEPTSESRLEGMRFFGGEPNFGFLDIAESDQLGLTSFNALLWGGSNRPRNDQLMWDLMATPNQRIGDPPPEIEQESDNVFIYGSGPFTLRPGESQRFSIALLLGNDFIDLLSNAEISQQVFESDYRFAQAPRKPQLVAVPGDGKVTLYWDTGAESSFDPFVSRANPDDPDKGFDFEGYRIYRSRDFSFNDTQTITDSRGVPFLSVPHLQTNGLPAQWDLVNEFSGLSDIEYAGRGVRYDLGRNTGLVHTYVDSNNVQNGVTYYYAVTSYDHGDANADIAPTESQRTIQRDAVTRLFTFDVNTASAVPGPPASGYNAPRLAGDGGDQATRIDGDATGPVTIEFLDPFEVVDNKEYSIIFEDLDPDTTVDSIGYSVVDPVQQAITFEARGSSFVTLGLPFPIRAGSVDVRDATGSSISRARYEVDLENGRIRGVGDVGLPAGEEFTIRFNLAPVSNSTLLNNEDGNPVFNGMKVFANADVTLLDPLSTEGGRSGFKTVVTNTNFSDEYVVLENAGVGAPAPWPGDFEFRFSDYDTLATGEFVNPVDTAIISGVVAPFKIVEVATGRQVDFFINETVDSVDNGRWDWQETIVLIQPDASAPTLTTYQIRFEPPSDTTGNNGVPLYEEPIYPGDGDVFLIFSTKPFDPGDSYSFTTLAPSFNDGVSASSLDDIIVVPNPYVAFSASEIAGVRTGDRDDRRIEFRNLPRECTIRIYTIVGELVDTIEKNDNLNYATWNLLSFESQQIAYGVYLFHVDAGALGSHVGRFAIIK